MSALYFDWLQVLQLNEIWSVCIWQLTRLKLSIQVIYVDDIRTDAKFLVFWFVLFNTIIAKRIEFVLRLLELNLLLNLITHLHNFKRVNTLVLRRHLFYLALTLLIICLYNWVLLLYLYNLTLLLVTRVLHQLKLSNTLFWR